MSKLKTTVGKLRLGAVALALAVPLIGQTATASAQAAETARTFVHAQGEVTIAAVPKRIAVLDLAALDILDGLGVEAAGVPTLEENLWPEYLKKYTASSFTPVGDLFQPDIEALKKLQPDLIIVAGRSAGKLKDISGIAPTIDLSTGNTAFVPSVAQNILLLGRILNREPQASVRAESLLRQVRELHAKAAKAGHGLLLFGFGDSVSVQYPQTRFGVVYELLGIAPTVSVAEAPPPFTPSRASTPAPAPGSPEAAAAEQRQRAAMQQRAEAESKRLADVIQREPDWLFVIDRSAAFGERANAAAVLQASAAITGSQAWQRKQVLHFDGREWYLAGGSPSAVERTIRQFSQALDAVELK